MKANELRIGNWVEYYLEPQISEWVENKISVGDLAKIIQYPKAHGFRPIPLTEEKLIELGFQEVNCTKRGVLAQYSKSKIKFDISNSGNVYLSHKNILIKHVHHLQNLMFALTREELTLTKKL